MADARRKDAIETFSGRVIRPLSPDPEDICIEDIAHSLANSCRFTGHTRQFYSVAQHSFLVADLLSIKGFSELGLHGLLHDASEAYLSDIARPVKRAPTFSGVYDEIEDRLMSAIAEAFDLPSGFHQGPEVIKADLALFRIEVEELMTGGPVFESWLKESPEWEWPYKLWPANPDTCEEVFLETFNALKGTVSMTAEKGTG